MDVGEDAQAENDDLEIDEDDLIDILREFQEK